MKRPRLIRTRRDRGAVIPIVALSLTMLMTMTAFAIDLGRMRTERRDLQADADAIALDAAQVIRGLNAVDAQAAALIEANASAVRNGLDVVLGPDQVRVGEWDFDIHDIRHQSLATEFPNAVEVRLDDTVKMFFDFSTDERAVARRAVAVAQPGARGQIGSVLAGLEQTVDPVTAPCRIEEQASFMNALYGSMLGITASLEISGSATVDTGPCVVTPATPAAGLKLDVLSWKGLGAGDVDLEDVATVMAGVASKDDLFDGTVDAKEFLQASATVLQASPDVADVRAGTILGQIANRMTATTQIDLNDIVDPGVGNAGAGTGNGSAAAATVDALTLLTGSAMLINGDNLAAVDVPLNLPFLSSPVQTRVHVVEPPQTHLDYRTAGQLGARTAQVRVAIEVPLKDVLLNFGIVGGLLGPLGVQSTTGNIKMVIEVGRAQSTYDHIACPADGVKATTMSVDTGAVTASYGALATADFKKALTQHLSTSVQLHGTFGVSVPLVGTVGINLNQITDVKTTQTFMTELDALASSATEVNLLGANAPHTFVEPFGPTTPWHRYPGGISGTALADTTYGKVQYKTAIGSALTTLGITEVALDRMIRDSLDSATGSIIEDIGADIIDPLLGSLGITLAGADGRMLDVQCGVPALANRD